MEETHIFEGGYIAHWNMTELYPEVEEELRRLLDSGEDFDTGIGECKHSSETLRIKGIGGLLQVSMAVSLPELSDILSEEFDEDDFSELLTRLEAALDDGDEYVTQAEDMFTEDRETGYEEVMERTKRHLDALTDVVNQSKETVLELAREISGDI